MGLSAIPIIYTVSYGTIAVTWLPAIPPFDFWNRHFWNLRPPSRTFLMGLSAIFIIYTVSYGAIAGTQLSAIPPFEFSYPAFWRRPPSRTWAVPKNQYKRRAARRFPELDLARPLFWNLDRCLDCCLDFLFFGLLPGISPGLLTISSLDHFPGLDFCSRYAGVATFGLFSKCKSAFLSDSLFEIPVQPLRLWLG